MAKGKKRNTNAKEPYKGVKNKKNKTKCEPVWPSGKALGW